MHDEQFKVRRWHMSSAFRVFHSHEARTSPPWVAMFVIMEPVEKRNKGKTELSPTPWATKRRDRRIGKKFMSATRRIFGAPPIDVWGGPGGFKLQLQVAARRVHAAWTGNVANRARGGNSQPGVAGLFSRAIATITPQYLVPVTRHGHPPPPHDRTTIFRWRTVKPGGGTPSA